MSKVNKKKPYKKIALALSLCLVILWALLGTGASLAWFTDTSNEVSNIFHFADFELEVSQRLSDGSWDPIDEQTKIFNEEALYEPGYVQVVYLKVKNNGDVPFDFYTSVSINDYTTATHVFGQEYDLYEYLKFGVAVADSEADMDKAVETRALAKEIANMKLSNYDTDTATLQAGETSYLALVVRMPEGVNNEANYRGDTIPTVELGAIFSATQKTN